MVYLGPTISKPAETCEARDPLSQILPPLPTGDVAEDDIQVGDKSTEAMCSTELIHLVCSVKALVEDAAKYGNKFDSGKFVGMQAALSQARRTLQVVANWPNDQGE
jgi:hypothetical protein